MVELVITGVTKAFAGRKVLHDIHLTVSHAHLLAVLGPSGSGKTTLLRLVGGFERCDQGTIQIGGEIVSRPGIHVAPERRRVGYVAQDGALFPHLSVGDNVSFGLPRAERRRGGRVGEVLDLVGLPQNYSGRAPHELSGGEQQRVALARALAPRPQLVLLDEPFSALDAGLRIETRKGVVAALRYAQATAILVTHDQAEALSLSDEVAVLLDGQLVQSAPPTTLYNQPKTAAIARFLGGVNLIPGQILGRTVECALGRLELAAELPCGPAEVLVRPEQIRIRPPGENVSLSGTVVSIEYYGHDVSIGLAVAGLELTGRAVGPVPICVGAHVSVTVEGPVTAFA